MISQSESLTSDQSKWCCRVVDLTKKKLCPHNRQVCSQLTEQFFQKLGWTFLSAAKLISLIYILRGGVEGSGMQVKQNFCHTSKRIYIFYLFEICVKKLFK